MNRPERDDVRLSPIWAFAFLALALILLAMALLAMACMAGFEKILVRLMR